MSTETAPNVENLSLEQTSTEGESALSTVDFTVVHPLRHEWTIWFLNASGDQASQNWSNMLKQVASFDTVEQFWGAFNSLPPIEELPKRSDLGVFRKGIRPEWEDPAFKTGGKWTFQAGARDEVDRMWMDTLCALIGSTLDSLDNEVAMGVFVLVRRANIRIQLWVKCDMQGSIESAKNFKAALGLSEKQKIEYSPFHTVGSL